MCSPDDSAGSCDCLRARSGSRAQFPTQIHRLIRLQPMDAAATFQPPTRSGLRFHTPICCRSDSIAPLGLRVYNQQNSYTMPGDYTYNYDRNSGLVVTLTPRRRHPWRSAPPRINTFSKQQDIQLGREATQKPRAGRPKPISAGLRDPDWTATLSDIV